MTPDLRREKNHKLIVFRFRAEEAEVSWNVSDRETAYTDAVKPVLSRASEALRGIRSTRRHLLSATGRGRTSE